MTNTIFTCYIFCLFLFFFYNRLAVVPLRAQRNQGNIEAVRVEMKDFDATRLASVEVIVKKAL